jgi:hypothetical protein
MNPLVASHLGIALFRFEYTPIQRRVQVQVTVGANKSCLASSADYLTTILWQF